MQSPSRFPHPDHATRHLRISRLLRGACADLESNERARAEGWTCGVDGRPIDDVIASLRGVVAMWERKLAEVAS